MKDYLYTIKQIIKTIAISLFFIFYSCSESPQDLRAKADKLYISAQDYFTRGYLLSAEELFEEIIKIENELKLSDKKADCYTYLGLISFENSDFKKAIKHYETAKYLYKKKFDRKGVGMTDNNIGNVYAALGYMKESLHFYKSALLTGQISADKEGEAIALMNIGSLYLENKEFGKGFDYFNKAYDNYQIIGSLDGELQATIKIGECFFRFGALTDALNTFRQAYEVAEEISEKGAITEILNYLGMIYAKTQNYNDAITILNSSLTQALKNDDPYMEAIILSNLADVNAQQFDYQNAIGNYSKAVEKYKSSGKGLELLYTELKLANTILKKGILEDNKQIIKNAQSVFEKLTEKFEDSDDLTGNINSLSGEMVCAYELKDVERSKKIALKIEELLPLSTAKIANKYSEKMIIPPSVFNYNDYYKTLINQKDNASFIKTVFSNLELQIDDFAGRLKGNKISNSGGKGEIDSLKGLVSEFNFQKLELINELSKSDNFRNTSKIRNLEDGLDEKDDQSIKKYSDHLAKVYLYKSYSFENLRKRIDNKTAIVTLLLVNDSLNIFIISKNNILKKRLFLSQEVLSGQVRFISEDLTKNNIEKLEPILKGLYQKILKPNEQVLGNFNRLIFLSLNDRSSEINYLPFHSLIDENNKKLSEKYVVSYFGGFKEPDRNYSLKKENVLVYDSLNTAIKNISNLSLIKSSNLVKNELLRKSIDRLFLFSGVFMSMDEPNNSYIKLSNGNDVEYDLKIGEIRELNVKTLYSFNYFSDNSSTMKMFSYLSPNIDEINIVLYNNKEFYYTSILKNALGQKDSKTVKIENKTTFDFSDIPLFRFVKL